MIPRLPRIAGALLDAVLRAADDRELTAPEIADSVEELSHGATTVSRGGLYVSLFRLRDDGLIASREVVRGKRRRVVYFATEKGRALRRNVIEAARVADLKAGTIVRGHLAQYEIEREYIYGSKAATFLARVVRRSAGGEAVAGLKVGAKVVIKCAFIDLERMTAAEARLYAARVTKAIRLEIPTLLEINSVPSVAKTFDSGDWSVTLGSGEELRLPFLVQERLTGAQLSRFVAKNHPHGLSSASDWFDIAEQLAKGLIAVHERGTVFRNIFPNSILLGKGDRVPRFADLGEALFAQRPPGHGDDESSAYLAPELMGQPPRPSRRADLYGIGGVLFFLATGRVPAFGPIRDDEALKRSVFEELVAFPTGILRQNFGIADIIARCLRASPGSRTQTAQALLQDIQLFKVPEKTDLRFSMESRVKRIGELVEKLAAHGGGPFLPIGSNVLAKLEDSLEELIARNVGVSGGHDAIVLQLSSFLSPLGLTPGSRYDTVSVPKFFAKHNLGVTGRFLAMNLEAARRGAYLRRVFLLTHEDRTDEGAINVIRAQIRIQRLFDELRSSMQTAGSIEMWFRIMEKDEVDLHVRRGKQAGVSVSGDSIVWLTPIYNSQDIITDVRIKADDREDRAQARREVETWFSAFHTGAYPLSDGWATHPKWPRPLESR